KLKEIEPENLQAVEVFLELLQNTQDWDIARWSAQSLGEIGNNKLEVVQTLLDLLISTPERRIARSTVYGLKQVFAADGLALLVTSLKGYLNDETWENNFPLYTYAFEILWHCASRMPYPDFYALWHGKETESEN
ncbi:MAG: HEAT repeat domain-containing protein, partial [Symploca sp. SIO2E6]|nr:HEAT repeat domain-containing protein [Symploca sp. SIO2E6]